MESFIENTKIIGTNIQVENTCTLPECCKSILVYNYSTLGVVNRGTSLDPEKYNLIDTSKLTGIWRIKNK